MLSTTSLLGMNHEELLALVSEAGQPSYRAKQIMDAVYRQRVESLAEISTLPSEFREWLEQSGVTVGAAQIENKFVSQDGTVRYLIAFADGQSVETVWMPEGDGGEAGDGSEAGRVMKFAQVLRRADRKNVRAQPRRYSLGARPSASPARWVAPWTASSASPRCWA